MRLVCPNCSSQYEVDASLFPEEGREVQCSNCEEVWVQYPEAEEPPLRLDQMAAVPAPPRPSERLPQEERDELARAVDQELTQRRASGLTDHDDETPEPSAHPEEEEDILASLREQIAAEGGDFEKDSGPAKSGRRDLRKAAEAVGVEVADATEEEKKARKWDLEKHEQDRERYSQAGGRRDPLARAIQSYEAEAQPRRRGGIRAGFITALVLVAIAVGVHQFRGEISEAYPPAEPYLAQYDGAVEDARVQVEALYAEYSVVVKDQIAGMTGETPAE
ncbi:zinc-ribbon domain-containing protein [Halovulum sp. GXIMD14794]